jgi:parallel beta-helix repeat protein
LLICSMLITTGCKKKKSDACDSNIATIRPGENAEALLREAMIDVENGNHICLSEGIFNITNTLTMDGKSGVTITGSEKGATTLSFAGQSNGNDGVLISNSEAVVVKDLTIRDTKGDGIKFTDSDGIVMHRLRVEWSGGPSSENGGYGIYPVLSSNILIDSSYVTGASDAGIYVGQSENAVIRNSTAEENVAGIQVENTSNADVYDNRVVNNAAGIMVFDLPGLTREGAYVRVFDNLVENNNTGNFAPSGIVSALPAGTGILTMSTDHVEIFNNEVLFNNVLGTVVVSFNSMIALGAVQGIPIDLSYNPLNVYVHNNTYSRENSYVTGDDQSELGNLIIGMFGDNPIPDIVIDGFFSQDADEHGSICINENINNSFVNLNVPDDFPNNLSFDPSMHVCEMDPLPEVMISVPAGY